MATVFAVVTAIGYRVLAAKGTVPRPGRVPEQLVRADQIRAYENQPERAGSLR